MAKVSSLANRNLEERSFQGQRSRSNPGISSILTQNPHYCLHRMELFWYFFIISGIEIPMAKVSSLANRNLEGRSFQGQRSRSNPRNFFIFDPKSTSFPPLNGIMGVLFHHIWYIDTYD